MTNKHIEVVKKWLADKDSVSHEELKANANAARADAAAWAAYVAADAAAWAADDAADAAYAADAACWIKRYEELTDEKEI